MPEHDDDDWLDPNDLGGLWEHQGTPLTVRWLTAALGEVVTGEPSLHGPIGQLLAAARSSPTAAIPVEVAFYDGAASRTLHPMHIDVRADQGRPLAVVITVT
jgi:hypothetical protein